MEVIQAHSSELEGRLKKHFTTSEVILRHPFHNRKRNNFRVGTTELPTEDTAARLFKVPGFDTKRVKQKLIGHKSRDRGDSAASPIEELPNGDLIELRDLVEVYGNPDLEEVNDYDLMLCFTSHLRAQSLKPFQKTNKLMLMKLLER